MFVIVKRCVVYDSVTLPGANRLYPGVLLQFIVAVVACLFA